MPGHSCRGIILMLWIVLEWYVWGFVALSHYFN